MHPSRLDPSGLDLGRLLAPRSVAVVGASERPGSYAAQTLLNLARAGFSGRVVGVNPGRAQAFGVPCVPTLADLDGPVDAVVVATPAATVVDQVDAAGALGCGGVVVFAAGFEDAAGQRAQVAVREAAARHGLPVIGPNSNGLVAVGGRAPLWGDAAHLPASPGPVALVTQSGNVGVVGLAHRRGEGLHTVVSLGNAAVVDAAAAVSHLAGTPGVRCIAVYLEDDGDGARLADALAECARHDVRLAVLKVGRSSEGRAAGAAHTAALAGDHRVFAALVRQAGGVLVGEPHDLLETARALAAGRRHPGRVAVLTSSGGDAAMAADLADVVGVPLAPLHPTTRARLAEALPSTAQVGNPLDHTNLVWADTTAVARIAEALARDPDVGHLLYVQDEPPGLPETDRREWAATREGGRSGAHRAGLEALLVATTPGQEPPQAVSGLGPALASLAALRRPAPDPGRLHAIAEAVRAWRVHPVAESGGSREGWLSEHATKQMLVEAGIAVPAHGLAASAAAAARTAQALGFPVAIKLSAPGLLHKSEAGALALDVRTVGQARAAATRLLGGGRGRRRTDPGSAREGRGAPGALLLVERMVEPGVEVLVAVHHDGVVPALVVGLGGIWAEALDDVAVIPLPAVAADIEEALRGLRGQALLFGGRGRAGVDVPALCHLAERAAALLLARGLRVLELNPVVVAPIGAVAVDALARVAAAGLDGPATALLS